MSYTYLQEQGEESSAASFSDIPPSVLSNSNHTGGRCSFSASETESCHDFPSGTTCRPLTVNRGADGLMPSAVDSHAKTSQPVHQHTQGWTESEAAYGERCIEWFAKFDPASSSWKIRQTFLFEDLEESLERWPRWGSMRSGECFQEDTSVPLLKKNDFLLPAPTKSMGQRGWGISNQKARYSERLEFNARRFGYKPHPSVLEWSMGWIPTWTRLRPLEMARFQSWLRSHGEAFSTN